MSSDPIVDLGVPLLVFVAMAVVGTDLTIDSFRRVRQDARLVVLATLGQVGVLPLLCAGLVAVFRPPALLTAGLVLLAACPAGSLANFYTYLAGANTALAVTLTAISSLVSVITLPIVAKAGFALLLSHDADVQVPVFAMMGQLVFLMVVPVGVGMLVRARRGEWVAAWNGVLRGASLGAVALLAVYIAVSQFDAFVRHLGPVVVVAFSMTVAAMLAGLGVSVLGRGRRADHFTLMIEFSTRSLAVAIVVATTLLGRPDFVVVATAFLAVQTALAFGSIWVYRATSH